MKTHPLNNDFLSLGVKKVVAIQQYKDGLISLGKMADFLDIDKQEAKEFSLKTSSSLNITP